MQHGGYWTRDAEVRFEHGRRVSEHAVLDWSVIFGAELRVKDQTWHRLLGIVCEVIRCFVGARCSKRDGTARMKEERAIRDSSRGPGIELQPAIRSHQESAYRRAVHNTVGHIL